MLQKRLLTLGLLFACGLAVHAIEIDFFKDDQSSDWYFDAKYWEGENSFSLPAAERVDEHSIVRDRKYFNKGSGALKIVYASGLSKYKINQFLVSKLYRVKPGDCDSLVLYIYLESGAGIFSLSLFDNRTWSKCDLGSEFVVNKAGLQRIILSVNDKEKWQDKNWLCLDCRGDFVIYLSGISFAVNADLPEFTFTVEEALELPSEDVSK